MKTTKKVLLLVASCAILMFSCKKKSSDPAPVTPAPVSTGAPSITSALYFQAKIDGAWVTFQDGIGNFSSGVSSSGNQIQQQDALFMNYVNGQAASFFIIKTFTSSPSNTDIEGMFGIKSYSFGNYNSNIDGAGISYYDSSGQYWSTDSGTGIQTGSTFSISEITAGVSGQAHKIVKANFSCKLYDGNGNSKTLTNGVLRGRAVMY